MVQTLKLYNKFAGGKWLFSKVICFKAPYFATIKPNIIELKPGYCEILLKKHRKVEFV